METLVILGTYLALLLAAGAGHALLLIAEDRHLAQTKAGQPDAAALPAAVQDRSVLAGESYILPQAGDHLCRQQAAEGSRH